MQFAIVCYYYIKKMDVVKAFANLRCERAAHETALSHNVNPTVEFYGHPCRFFTVVIV